MSDDSRKLLKIVVDQTLGSYMIGSSHINFYLAK